MSEELKSTQIVYGENVLMMRVDDCLIFGNKNALRSLAEKLTELPSVEPEQKKGKWVDAVLYHEPDDFEWEKVKCSSCKIFVTKPIFYYNNKYNFCPNCGADMRGE